MVREMTTVVAGRREASMWTRSRKISSELSRESLLEFYHFRQQNSDVDLDKYFDDLSGKPKEFIQENLRQIELEEGGRGKFSNGSRSPDLLVPHIENLLNACALKLNVAHNVYLNSDCQMEEVFRQFEKLFSVILDVSTLFGFRF
jgi:hypothetical protein